MTATRKKKANSTTVPGKKKTKECLDGLPDKKD
jgi:hypothetical protein